MKPLSFSKYSWALVYLQAFLFIIMLYSCNNEEGETVAVEQTISKKDVKKKIEAANKMYVKRESDEIDQYVKFHEWNMTKTGTGLRYMVIKKGKGKTVLPGMEATINYKVKLLDGTLCYSSDVLGSKTFLVEQDNVESGLHEGIQKLREGDMALFILPSHLAHGLLGDESKIPTHASVVYEIELLSAR
jgi:FKBP-type peptidyl-prolyl cis-trans isomerase FkpA